SCQGQANENYKDPNNCYGFITCSNGLAYHMDCPAGLKYNEQTDQCDLPQNVTC
ncbi:chitin binding, partial [Desmophyllum pertusum]